MTLVQLLYQLANQTVLLHNKHGYYPFKIGPRSAPTMNCIEGKKQFFKNPDETGVDYTYIIEDFEGVECKIPNFCVL